MSDVSDVFREVDEEVRREQLKKLWERYGHYALVLAVLLVAGVAAWRGYGWWEAKKAAEAGAAFESAIALSDAGKHAEAEAAFAKIAADGSSGYRPLARIREATELAQTDPEGGRCVPTRKSAMTAPPRPVLRDLAALRAGALLIDAANYPDAQRLLEPLTAPDRTFRHTARELLALAAWRQGDAPGTKRWFDMLATDPLTPTATRTRAEMLMALVAAETKS